MSDRCPQCKNRLVQKSSTETKIRVQGPITIDTNGMCKGQCHWCKSVVELPLELVKAYDTPAERLVIVEHGSVKRRDGT